MANCKRKVCGLPLTRGNIRVVRKPGKRTYRTHRVCPLKVDPKLTEISTSYLANLPTMCDNCPDKTECYTQDPAKRICLKWSQPRRDTAGNVVQWPQEGTGGPIVVEGVLDFPTPPKYRYFITRAAAEKLQRMSVQGGGRATVELIPVPEYQVEADPEVFLDYVELEINMKGGEA